MDISTETQPSWYNRIPEERRGVWVESDGKRELSRVTLAGFPIRVILKNGDILDGEKGEERDRAGNHHDIAIRMDGRKTQKWIPEEEIAVAWTDRGPDLSNIMDALMLAVKEELAKH